MKQFSDFAQTESDSMRHPKLGESQSIHQAVFFNNAHTPHLAEDSLAISACEDAVPNSNLAVQLASFDPPQEPKTAEKQKAPHGKLSPAERSKLWRDKFSSGKISSETIRQTVDDLVQSKQYEEVIACLEQAIIQGRMEPWMYEVLALSMEVAGRPKAQIERVLLSSQDLVTNNATSMMVLAAYLTRFERYDRAIELYRQAAHLQPDRPEPFLQALSLARRTRNAEAIVWCAPEVVTYAWGSEREQLRREAEQAAADAVTILTKAGKLSKVIELQKAMQKASEIDLALRLDWNGQGDLDLSIEEPGGTVCSTQTTATTSGGIFAHDGFGPNQTNCYDEYLCPRAKSGEYKARIRHLSGDIVGKRARLTIIRGKGTPEESSETQTVLLGKEDVIVRISLSRGRRAVVDNRLQTLSPIAKGPTPQERTAMLAQIGNNPSGQIGNRQTAGLSNVGYQPVVQFINEGITMNALATVSGDRRYVRISAQPMFSNITDVFTFSFIGGGGGQGGSAGPTNGR